MRTRHATRAGPAWAGVAGRAAIVKSHAEAAAGAMVSKEEEVLQRIELYPLTAVSFVLVEPLQQEAA